LTQVNVNLQREIRRRERVETELRQTEGKFREIFQNTSDSIIIFRIGENNSLILEDVNPALNQSSQSIERGTIGKTLDDLLQITVDGNRNATPLIELRSLYYQCIQTGLPIRTRHQLDLPIGLRWFDTVIVPIKRTNGRVIRVAGISRDLTVTQQVEEELRALEHRYHLAFNANPAYMCITDMDRKYIDVNDAFARRIGLPREEIIGKRPREVGFVVNLADARPIFDGLQATGMVRDIELHAQMPDKQMGVGLASAAKIELDGKPCILWAILDITQRKQAENMLKSLNAELEGRVRDRTDRLEAINKELEAFSYSVSHDLRAPLRAIDGFSKALLEDYRHRLDTDGQDYLLRVRNASQRMGELIDDLLNLSRVTRAEIVRTDVNLTSIAERIIADLQQHDPERKVEILIQPDVHVRGDAKLLTIVVDNLLNNAWKYTRKQPSARIEFGTKEEPNQKVYFVRDNGTGFDPVYQNKLFTPFQRLHRASEFEGHGIGLATIRRIIERHSGKVWAEGTVDQGATFYFTLH
jgi:PAS domain S-box-containing protein